MDDLDFSKRSPAKAPEPAKTSIYDAHLAEQFFKLAGTPETVPEGKILFEENEKGSRLLLKRDKMYLLLEGEVILASKNKLIGTVKKGEIFGEMASISQTPRSATAVAKRACRVIGLDNKEFESALRKMPDFALMLMSVMIGRLRNMIAQGGASLAADGKPKETTVFDEKSRSILARALGDQSLVRFEREGVIMREGQAGVLMYVVLEGRVAVTIQGKLVERVGPGGVFGEMALVERTPRLASAVAETGCTLLAINRNTFLNLVRASPDFGVALLGAVGERARQMAGR
jgi:CRP/FNR family transcriptional regulator, cyclic AMP receptor protein